MIQLIIIILLLFNLFIASANNLLQILLTSPSQQKKVTSLLTSLLSNPIILDSISYSLENFTQNLETVCKDTNLMDEFVKPAHKRLLYKKYMKEGGDHCGLQNLGCICYMLSVMQQFFMITPFRQGILQVCVEREMNKCDEYDYI